MFEWEKYIPEATGLRLTVAGAILILLGVTLQKSCGAKHETKAIVYGVQGDDYKAQVKDLKQQLDGKNKEIESLKAWGRTANARLKVLEAKVQTPLPPVPATDPELASSLKKLGLQPQLQVHVTASSSLLSTVDAQTVWVAFEEAKRVPLLNEALVACDQSVKAQEAIVASQDSQIVLFRQGLMASQSETDARTAQVNELAKALRVEKSKGWKLIAYPVAAAALTAFWMKK